MNIIQHTKTLVLAFINYGVGLSMEFGFCCNPSPGFVTKARACKGASQEGNLGITSHALESVGECEGMNLHTPK